MAPSAMETPVAPRIGSDDVESFVLTTPSALRREFRDSSMSTQSWVGLLWDDALIW
jgi:hypothetical protein